MSSTVAVAASISDRHCRPRAIALTSLARLVRTRYDDGGYSGGSTERPALQRLLADIRDRKIDIVVVYKVDRLTRSLADFAKLVELFDAHGVSFVSVTQQFNTTTSMGRLTLNVLLSFAQFEREVTSERIRDKIGASKRKGLWVGGMVPLGYVSRDKKLVIDEDEAERVRTIFRRYLELGSLGALLSDLRERGIVTRMRHLSNGRTVGGIPFTRGPLPTSCATDSTSAMWSSTARSLQANIRRFSTVNCSRQSSEGSQNSTMAIEWPEQARKLC
jgi:DNA invertase Pin-like site-specific DNA recombinase